MNTQPVFDDRPSDGDLYDQIAVALERDGYIVLPQALAPAAVDGLFLDLKSLDQDEFKRAGIGRQNDFQVNPFVRSDRVRWLDGEAPAARFFMDWMAALKVALNRRLFLGLFDYECHYASYPVGAFYKKHVDAFKGRSNRVLSTVFYLNPVWQPGDGGELVIYHPDTDDVLETVLPEYGKLVIFLSEEFPHEVLAGQRERNSIAGWFRVNASSAALADPAV